MTTRSVRRDAGTGRLTTRLESVGMAGGARVKPANRPMPFCIHSLASVCRPTPVTADQCLNRLVGRWTSWLVTFMQHLERPTRNIYIMLRAFRGIGVVAREVAVRLVAVNKTGRANPHSWKVRGDQAAAEFQQGVVTGTLQSSRLATAQAKGMLRKGYVLPWCIRSFWFRCNIRNHSRK
jgi:hypothetical protein